MKPGLYIVGTPIGNLDDTTARALETLRNVDFILAEDTRHTRILLDRFQIRTRLMSCHRFNECSRIPFVLEQINAGKTVALVTNAGMPGVADPGSFLVRAGRQNHIYITVIPGPSSVTAAVALSGFGGGGFVCEGFLPRKKGARRRRLVELKAMNRPIVVLESPYRCLRFLEEIRDIFQDREIFMGRELTKLNEECLWGTAEEISRRLSEKAGGSPGWKVKGELTFVIAPPSKQEKREFTSRIEKSV
ncbi:MAG: 16S rRNA (cytidine(1402)-2'-O)-methyltransferase [Kiritimatiellia bacterium]|nr:16S rRNA (cytidine(1402)-2'-O)-methyltransferase [Kiritimatiellia bacterium]